MPRPARRAVSGPGPSSSSSPAPHSAPASADSAASISSPSSSSSPETISDLSFSTSSASSSSSSSSRRSRHSLSSSFASIGTADSVGGSGGGGGGAAASRTLDRSVSQIELLYNTAVQEFVRRNHVRAQNSLGRLLDLLARDRARLQSSIVDQSPSAPVAGLNAWWDPSPLPPHLQTNEEWTIKSLKLAISSLASLYADAPTSARLDAAPEPLDPVLRALLPPAPANGVLDHLHATCARHLVQGSGDGGSPESQLQLQANLPPAIISTLLLAALKIPSPAALDWAHALAEDWIAGLPDAFFGAVQGQGGGAGRIGGASGQGVSGAGTGAGEDAERKRRIEGAREGYLKVVELFTGEVLVREGEWEMARAFLDEEGMMGSKRKESLYKHIRAAERSRAAQTTPTSSGILPRSGSASASASASASGGASRTRSRSGSTASSESEATARPSVPLITGHSRGGSGSIASGPASRLSRRNPGIGDGSSLRVPGPGASAKKASGPARDLSAERERGDDASTTASTRSTLPSRIFVNPFGSRGALGGGAGGGAGAGAGAGGGGTNGSGAASPARGRPRPSGNGRDQGQGWNALLALLPRGARGRVEAVVRRPWLLAVLGSLPVGLMALLIGLVLRRKWRRAKSATAAAVASVAAVAAGAGGGAGGNPELGGRVRKQGGMMASPAGIGAAVAPQAAPGGAGGLVDVALSGVESLQERLKRQRERGWGEWWFLFWAWWVRKMRGVWRMGTTITYI